MSILNIEVERRFPVDPNVFEDVEKVLNKVKEYDDIIDTYYIFNLLKRTMVRARSISQTYPDSKKGMKYQLCAKDLFSPAELEISTKREESRSIFELNEIEVKVDDFEKLIEIFARIKEEEFTIKGNRRCYQIRNYSGSFPTLMITTDFVENLHHNYWVEIEILLDDPKQHRLSEALNEICTVALKCFGICSDYVRYPSYFPTYPEIYFWENWYQSCWVKSKSTHTLCSEFDPNGLKELQH